MECPEEIVLLAHAHLVQSAKLGWERLVDVRVKANPTSRAPFEPRAAELHILPQSPVVHELEHIVHKYVHDNLEWDDHNVEHEEEDQIRPANAVQLRHVEVKAEQEHESYN
jgi:hypothetical protein